MLIKKIHDSHTEKVNKSDFKDERKASGVVRRGGSKEKGEGQGGYIRGREGSRGICIYVERIMCSSALGILGKPTGALHSQTTFQKQIIFNI